MKKKKMMERVLKKINENYKLLIIRIFFDFILIDKCLEKNEYFDN